MFFSKKSSSLTSHDLRDFSANRRLLLLVVMAVVVGTFGAGAAWLLQHLINLVTNLCYFGRLSASPVNYLQPSAGLDICSDPSGGVPRHRPDGTLRLGENTRPWNPRSDRSHPHRKKPHSAQGRSSETSFLRHLDRNGRAVRRRRTDHHDRRRAGLDLRAVVPYEFRRTKNPARRGRCGGYERDVQLTHRRHPAGCRVAALRMEAAQLHSGQRRLRRSGGMASVPDRRRHSVSDDEHGCSLHALDPACLRRVGDFFRSVFRPADPDGLYVRGFLSETAYPLDVVAGDRRLCHRAWRPDRAARAGRRLR